MIPLNFFKTSKSKAVQIYKKKEKKLGCVGQGQPQVERKQL